MMWRCKTFGRNVGRRHLENAGLFRPCSNSIWTQKHGPMAPVRTNELSKERERISNGVEAYRAAEIGIPYAHHQRPLTNGKKLHSKIFQQPQPSSIRAHNDSSPYTSVTGSEILSDDERSFVGSHSTSILAHEELSCDAQARLAIRELGHAFLSSYLSDCRQKGACATAPKEASVCPSSSISTTVSSFQSQAAAHKRRARPGGDDEKEDSSRKRSKKSCMDTSGDDQVGPIFACPYSKFDPGRYSVLNLSEAEYSKCSACCLRDISRLKQHLYRVHKRPAVYCMRCFQVSGGEDAVAELATHSRRSKEDLCNGDEECPFAEKMTPDQFQRIKKRRKGEPPAQIWYFVFDTLFPGALSPPSPYVEGLPEVVARDLFGHIREITDSVAFREVIRSILSEELYLDDMQQLLVPEAVERVLEALLSRAHGNLGDTQDTSMTEDGFISQRSIPLIPPPATNSRHANIAIPSRKSKRLLQQNSQVSSDPSISSQSEGRSSVLTTNSASSVQGNGHSSSSPLILPASDGFIVDNGLDWQAFDDWILTNKDGLQPVTGTFRQTHYSF